MIWPQRRTRWLQDQGLTRLALAGTVDENTVTKALVLKYARNPDKAALFNYASMAHNNFFFFSTLVRCAFCVSLSALAAALYLNPSQAHTQDTLEGPKADT